MTQAPGAPAPRPFWQPDLVYALVLFVFALGVLVVQFRAAGTILPDHDWRHALFFLVFGLFTIAMGYPHPSFGHVSFDRVGQVASILVLGPLDAAWINGLASLIFPWYRLARGESFRLVLTAMLNNAGLMTLVILIAGTVYTTLGGPVPLLALDWPTAGVLLLLMASMQLLNDVGMMTIFYIRLGSPIKVFSWFSAGVELSSVFIAVFVAIVFNRLEIGVFVLLLGVLSLGMFVLRQFALMRQRLEALVDERTRELGEKTLELELKATHDDLTGLHNRRYADEFLEHELDQAGRYGRALAVGLCDIDHFKQINDRHSHATGDEVLRRVARLLSERCRKTDMIARYGGEEFLLCFPETSAREACGLCEELRRVIESESWPGLDASIAITLSFGVAERAEDSSFESLLAAADKRLYQAKAAGRNRVVV